MAYAMFTTDDSAVHGRWEYDASENPYSNRSTPKWESYSDIENILIEEAYGNGETHAMLDDYTIDFDQKIQMLDYDSSKQRPVRRLGHGQGDTRVRKERFTFTPINPSRPFAGLYGWISPFIKEVAKNLRIEKDELPSRDETTISMVVKKAADGIIEEGKKIGKRREAEKLAQLLRQTENAPIEDVWRCCAHLYSMECFLYKRINETMRLIGSEGHEQVWRSRVSTLGPFCLLLWDSPYSYKSTPKGTVLYRGASLTEELIAAFAQDCSRGDKMTHSFPAFTSCSRTRHIAENFGNVLFIMTVKHAFSVDLRQFSQYPEEDEELLYPGVCFTIERVKFDKSNKKHLIYLELVQQHRQTHIHEISTDHSTKTNQNNNTDFVDLDRRLNTNTRDRREDDYLRDGIDDTWAQ